MVQTISKMIVKKDKVNDFISIFKEMIESTKNEEGYIQYEMYQDEENPALLIVLEQWDSREDFDKHLKSEHFERIVPRMSELIVGKTDVNITHIVA